MSQFISWSFVPFFHLLFYWVRLSCQHYFNLTKACLDLPHRKMISYLPAVICPTVALSYSCFINLLSFEQQLYSVGTQNPACALCVVFVWLANLIWQHSAYGHLTDKKSTVSVCHGFTISPSINNGIIEQWYYCRSTTCPGVNKVTKRRWVHFFLSFSPCSLQSISK